MKTNKWGGKRAGAGRKKSLFDRKGRTFRLTDAEFLEVKPLIDAIRNVLKRLLWHPKLSSVN